MIDANTYQAIAVSRPDGGVSIHRIIVRTPYNRFAPEVALSIGFVLSEDGEWWEGGITDEGVDLELERAGLALNAGWARVSNTDLPSREYRDRWVLRNGEVVIG